MRTAILALSLASLVLQTTTQSISFLTPSDSSSTVTFPQANNYDLFKNSNFTANCSFPFTTTANDNSDPSVVQTAYAQSQSDFCAQLNPLVPWFVWPTSPTHAAYLPNWVTAFLSFVVFGIKWLRGLFQIRHLFKHQPPFGRLDWLILFFDVGQLVAWWYFTASGFSDPLHANWVNPIQWLTPASYAFLILAAINDGNGSLAHSLAVFLCIALAAAGWLAGWAYISQRFTINLGSGSYIPLNSSFPELPANTTITCRTLLNDTTSPLYTDPNWSTGRFTQLFVAGATTYILCAWAPVMLLRCCFRTINVKKVTAWITLAWGIVIQFIVLTWLSALANQGVPLMFHEECGVVVIAMSPAQGYYDSKLHYDGLRLQAARGAFGLCKYFFVQTEYLPPANCASQRRLYIRTPCSVCVG